MMLSAKAPLWAAEPEDATPILPPKIESTRLQDTLARRFADLFVLPAGQIARAERALLDDMLVRLYPSLDGGERERLARRLGSLSEPPPQVMQLIAHDRIDIARIALEHESALDESELAAIVKTHGREHHRLVAGRRKLTPLLTDILIGYGNADTIATLLQNQDARISRRGFQCLTELARGDPGIAAALLARADLPVDVAHDLFWDVDNEQRCEILLRFSIERRRLSSGLRDLDVEDHAAQDETISAVLRLMGISNRMDTPANALDLVSALLANPGDEDAQNALAAILDLRPETLAMIAEDAGGEPLVVLLKALGVARRDIGMIESVLGPEWPPEDCSARMANLAWLFDSISNDWADVVLHLWNLERPRGLDALLEPPINEPESALAKNPDGP